MSKAINAKALTKAAKSVAEAVRQSRAAYQFCPGSYTAATFQACLAAARAMDQHISELAFATSAEWLRNFPEITAEQDDVE